MTPEEFARAAGLRYVYDSRPGITRLHSRGGFRYVAVEGRPLRDPDELKRIRALAIPPAWTDVWICPLANGHLQATGRDARGRKQSRYHAAWRAVRDEAKYEHMLLFADALPRIREQVERDLALPGLPRAKVVATVVRLIETTYIRVGNTEYARTNKSYGLTTMRNKHVEVAGSTVRFDFTGKSGVRHSIGVNDRRIAKIVKNCRDLPGYELFQYLDEEGERHFIEAADVNAYLAETTGQHFTAKDFRTWAGTVLACAKLRGLDAFMNESDAKKNVVAAVKEVASLLGNTPSVCRKCYVHPEVLEAYLSGGMLEEAIEAAAAEESNGLDADEHALVRLLRGRLAAISPQGSKAEA